MKLAARAAAAARGHRRGDDLGADRRRRAGRGPRPRGADRDASGRSRVEGHHYALVHVDRAAAPTRATPYEVALDGEVVWPEPDSRSRRASCAPTRATTRCGSCSAPAASPRRTSRRTRCARTSTPTGREVDALRGARAADARTRRPRSGRTRCCCSATRSTPTRSTRDVEEQLDGEAGRAATTTTSQLYTRRVGRAGDPLAALDRAQRDDLRRPRRPRRLEHVDRVGHGDARRRTGGAADRRRLRELLDLPAPREPLAGRARASSSSTSELRTGAGPDAARCARSPSRPTRRSQGTRWSFCRDIGPARVVMIDSRAGRVLDPGNRAMVDADEWRLDRASTPRGDVDHLLIGTSLPLFMGPALHWLEAWNEAVVRRRVGHGRSRSVGEKLRQELDLEHWPAFQESFRRMCDLLREVGAGRARRGAVDDLRAVAATSTTPTWPRSASRRARACSRAVWQAVCSPFRNPLDTQRAAGDPRRLDARRRARRRARWRARAGVRDPPVQLAARAREAVVQQPGRVARARRPARHVRAREGAPAGRRKGRARAWSGCSSARSNPTRDFARDLRHTLRAGVMIR